MTMFVQTGRHHVDDSVSVDEQTTVRGLLTQLGRERGNDPAMHAAGLLLDRLSRMKGYGRRNRHEKDPWT